VALPACLSVSVTALCPNACSGHGVCKTQLLYGLREGGFDECECFKGWTSAADCSERDCIYQMSWGGLPDRSGNYHYWAECANRGVCDRFTGECMCLDGFTGRGCQYDECPNDCSGHGTCEFIEDFGYVLPPTQSRGVRVSDREITYKPQLSRSWEYHKVRACKCDPQWTDHDCSRRMCPRANDVVDHREDLTDQPRAYQKQEIHLIAGGPYGSGLNASMEEFFRGSFSIVFVSLLNETFHTSPLRLDYDSFVGSWNRNWDEVANALAADIEDSLIALPNKVIDEIDVDVNFNSTMFDFGLYRSMNIKFQMTGEKLVGRQNLFAVDAAECLYPGCSPKLAGLNLVTFQGSGAPLFVGENNLTSWVEETGVTDYNSYECGRRGQCDYQTGLCECFEGFTGPSCSILIELF